MRKELKSGKIRILLNYIEIIHTDHEHNENGNVVGDPIEITEYEVTYNSAFHESIVELIRQNIQFLMSLYSMTNIYKNRRL